MMRKSHKDSVCWATSSVGVLLLIFIGHASGNKEGYFGKYVGKLSQLHHGVSGEVFAVDARTLHIRNFNYDGEGPAAYFYAGNSKAPGVDGFRVRDERGTTNVLPRYRNRHITITLPEGKTLQNIRWFSVWCDEFSVNFGDVKIPKNLDFPKPQKISGLSGVHGVSSEPIVIVDAQTLLIPSFSYDGEAPDAKFWVGRGFKPSPQGIRIPDENGKELPLRRYDRKTIVLTLPGDLTIFDIGHFGVWCEAFTVDFGHVQIPRGLNIPPSLKMLGVSPQSKLNCEVLWDDFAYEVRWAVAGDSIVLQLVARLENNEYMSFGLSGDRSRSRMVGGDVVVAWVDKESLRGFAKDYYLDAKSQCSGGRGSCPDENIQSGAESVRLLNAALVNGYSIVTFQRSLKPRDDLDLEVFTNRSQPVIWAIGPLNSRKEVSYHSLANRGDIFIDFGRAPKWNCPTPESVSEEADSQDSSSFNREPEEANIPPATTQDSARRESRPKAQIPTPAPAPKTAAWEIPPIKCHEPEDGVFYAQMGPTGGKHGYSAITGHVGWGISWYINGLLIPEINVVRGRTYTFIVEGGLDPETPARYHPFYITDDPVGGYQYKTPEERANIQIFAGAVQNKRGEVRPTGVGRLCNWTPDPNAPPADEFTSFGAYQRTLRLECDPGNPGIIQWTVEKDTPDTVYYQCYTHRYLGWKIRVHDDCEGEAASDPVPSVVKAPASVLKSYAMDSEGSDSIYHETRVKPDPEFAKITQGPNRTLLGANEFASLSAGSIQERPEDRRNVFGAKTASVKLRPAPEGPVAGVLLQEQVLNMPRPALLPPNVLVPSKSSGYSVSEEPSEGNFHQSIGLVPVLISHRDESLNSFRTPQKTHQQETVHIPERFAAGNKFRQQYKTNYPIAGVRTEEKPKTSNHKSPLGAKQPSKLPGGISSFQKPHPFPSPAFPPPYSPLNPPKRPVSLPSLKTPHHKLPKIPQSQHRINVALAPENLHRQETQPLQQIKLSSKKHHTPSLHPLDLFGSFTAGKPSAQTIPFAHNGGFDPESVQVEGGFKPILNTGVAPRARPASIDRAASEVEEEPDATVGIVESMREDSSMGAADGGEGTSKGEASKEEEVDLLKKQKPQVLEPIFIPSHPDDSVKKAEEYRKKPLLSLKPRYDELERFNLQQKGEMYVKTGAAGRVVRRPLYLDNMVPSFRTPHRSGTPQVRSHESGSAQEDDAVPGKEKTAKENTSSENPRAENIMQVIQKYEGEGPGTTAARGSLSEQKFKRAEPAQDEIAVADEKRDFYLPPKAEEFLSYDGKLVKAVEAPALPQPNLPADISKLPQFLPFKGAIPPLTHTINAKNLPQLTTTKLARQDILPPKNPNTENPPGQPFPDFPTDQPKERTRRSPDHIPGHQGHDHHHHHSRGSHKPTNLLLIASVSIAALSLQKIWTCA